MVRSCAAFGCTNKWKADSDITFHRIPKDVNLRKKWIQNIKREGKLPKDENFLICSIHFEENCFQRDLQAELMGTKRKRLLTADAVPTLFSFSCPPK